MIDAIQFISRCRSIEGHGVLLSSSNAGVRVPWSALKSQPVNAVRRPPRVSIGRGDAAFSASETTTGKTKPLPSSEQLFDTFHRTQAAIKLRACRQFHCRRFTDLRLICCLEVDKSFDPADLLCG